MNSRTVKAIMVFLENRILLSKKNYSHWLEIQQEYGETFKTCFPPMTCKEILQYFKSDYGCDDTEWPFSKKRICRFFKTDEMVLEELSER